MFIIYGTHDFGKVQRHGGEYVTTRFAHIYWLPLVPTGSRYVVRQLGDETLGFELKTSLRSVAAAYLRIWAPLFALIGIATLSIPGFAVAAVMLALSGWSWTWLDLRGERERRRALFNLTALGTACDLVQRTESQCEGLRRDLGERFAAVSNGRTPDDVARFGADTPKQAALAYATLRLLAATARGDTRQRARATSERILDGLKDGDAGALADGGPFRARPAAADLPVEPEAPVASDAPAPSGTDAAWVNSPDNPAVQAEIAANKQKNARRDRYLLIAAIVAAPFFVWFCVDRYLSEQAAADRGLATLRQVRDQVCACGTRACVNAVLYARRGEIQHAEEAINEVSSKRDDLDALAEDVERCIADLPR